MEFEKILWEAGAAIPPTGNKGTRGCRGAQSGDGKGNSEGKCVREGEEQSG